MDKLTTYRSFSSICQGASHEKSGVVCQDAVASFTNKKIAICVVSDGHGSEKHFRSDVGSKKAVSIAKKAIKEFCTRKLAIKRLLQGEETVLKELSAYIVTRWVDAVEKHLEENPCSSDELLLFNKYYAKTDNYTKIYGATLIAGVVTQECAFIIKNGDGAAFVIEKNGDAHIPKSTINEELFAGMVTSISDSNCLDGFRYYITDSCPQAIIVASDGVTDSYAGNDFVVFCSKLISLYKEDHEQAQYFLDDWLPKLSHKGARDDMSVAGVYLQ